MKKAVLLGVLAMLGGCAVPATTIRGPDGRQAYVLECSGFGRDRQDCLLKAGEMCPAGYSVMDDNSTVNGAMVINGIVAVARRDYLTISCK